MSTPDPVSAVAPPTTASSTQTITVAGGCFWCVEAVFLEVAGVLAVESGYSNGRAQGQTQGPSQGQANGHPGRGAPSYEQVCGGDTGFAEVVQLHFDPQLISLRQVLEIFLAVHNPTTLNRQGHDVGTQYRSGIYWQDPAQAVEIHAVLADAARVFADPIVTEVAALRDYWPAEAYHQRYFRAHPQQSYCSHVVAPKVGKFKTQFGHFQRAQPLP